MSRRRDSPPGTSGKTDSRAQGGRWRLRNWRLRSKLLAAVLIPTIAVVVLIGLQVRSDLAQAGRLAELAERVRLDNTVADLVHQLQRERDLTVRFVGGARSSEPSELRIQWGRVDAAMRSLERDYSQRKKQLSKPDAGSLLLVENRLDVLGGLRYAGEHSQLPADAMRRSYSELISDLLNLSDQAVVEIKDAGLGRLRLANNALSRVKDQMSIKRAIVAVGLAKGELPRAETRALIGADAELTAARNDFTKFATPDQQRMYDDTVIGLIVDTGNDMVESALARAETGGSLSDLSAQQWDISATYTVNLVRKVQSALYSEMQDKTDALTKQSQESAMTDGGVLLGVLAVGGVLAVLVARSLLRPLRTLRRSAIDVAQHRLPAAVEGIFAEPDPYWQDSCRSVDPVPVFSNEEIGEVARAFDDVHREAVRLAGDQALLRENVNAMFVNLSRRTKDLVDRQLSILDRMEEGEQDPTTLRGLFELDHLATRMRRNSENLLVLSGHDSGQSIEGNVSVDEIIGAALSEVEQYERIQISTLDNVAVVGSAASDLVHVVSELLENATTYSDQHTPVSVAGSITETGGLRLEVTDYGTGMSGSEIARTNARLARPPGVDVEVSRRMGLYVVATLAQRHQIQVRLSPAGQRGLVASVVVPAELRRPVSDDEQRGWHIVEQHETTGIVEAPTASELVEPGPVQRAPVEQREAQPEWPREQGDVHPLELDTPTDRLPAYQDVLTKWFDSSATEDGFDSGRTERADDVEADDTARETRRTVSLSPEAVRARMTSMQAGANRARHTNERNEQGDSAE